MIAVSESALSNLELTKKLKELEERIEKLEKDLAGIRSLTTPTRRRRV